MGKHPTRDSQRAIREISVDEGGGPRTLDVPAPPTGPGWWISALIAVAAVAGLGYGFLLGRGDPDRTDPTAPVTTAAATTTTTAAPTTDRLPGAPTETFFPFIRAAPGHDLGRGVTEYLDANRYHTIAADDQGFIWSGGPTGLLRLDPATGAFTRLTNSSGTGPVDVQDIAPAPDGSVWVATGRGLSHWEDGEWANDSRFPSRPAREYQVNALEVGSDGTVWLATHSWPRSVNYEWSWSGEFEADSNRIHWGRPPFAGDLSTVIMNDWISDLEEDPAGIMWALAGGTLWRFDGHSWQGSTASAGLQSMTIDANGDVWASREGRLLRWDGEQLTDLAWRDPPNVDSFGEPMEWIQSLAASPTGTVWALVNGWDDEAERDRRELVGLDENGATVHQLPELSSNRWYGDLTVAPDGSVWLTAGSTIVGFVDGAWTHYHLEDEPPLGAIHSLAVGPSGDLWVASDDGILHAEGDEWTVYGAGALGLPVEPGDDYRQFWVTTGPDGTVWGGWGCRAAHFSDGAWLALPPLPNESGECWEGPLAAAPGPSLWIRVHEWVSTTYMWDGAAWQPIEQPSADVSDLALAADGTMWVAGPSGLTRFDGREWKPVLAGMAFDHLAIAGDGTVWAAASPWSETRGLWRYNDGTWSRTRKSDNILSLERGPNGGVWALLQRDDGRAVVLDTEAGVTRWVVEEGDFDSMAVGPDGTIWVGGNGRLYRIDPD